MTELTSPDGVPRGEARRFDSELAATWDYFHAIEDWTPLVTFRFDDGRVATVGDLEDLPAVLLNCLVAYVEVPHTGYVHLTAEVHRGSSPFDIELAMEALDGPLTLRFADGTVLNAALPDPAEHRSVDRWTAAVSTGLAQQLMEEVATLANRVELVEVFKQEDRLVAEQLVRLVSEMAKAEQPPRGVVREAAKWLGRKVDVFLDEAVKVAGKTAGAVAVGGVAYTLHKHFPDLAAKLGELANIASGN